MKGPTIVVVAIIVTGYGFYRYVKSDGDPIAYPRYEPEVMAQPDQHLGVSSSAPTPAPPPVPPPVVEASAPPPAISEPTPAPAPAAPSKSTHLACQVHKRCTIPIAIPVCATSSIAADVATALDVQDADIWEAAWSNAMLRTPGCHAVHKGAQIFVDKPYDRYGHEPIMLHIVKTGELVYAPSLIGIDGD